jgi:hypothetical protein
MLAALLGVALLATVAAAQDSRWQRQVSTQLSRYSDVLSDKGYARTHEIKQGSLDDDESEYVTLELDAGRSYALLGVCDEDCSDLDMRLYDADGNEIDSDIETDDYPVVEVRPVRTARFRVKVSMAACSTSPCFYGVAVYGK